VLVDRHEILRFEAPALPHPPLERQELAQAIVSAEDIGVEWPLRCVYLDVRIEHPEIETGRAAEAHVVKAL
jgi:hypothetical protein